MTSSRSLRIGLSYRGEGDEYAAYPAALQRRADALGIAIETEWLASREAVSDSSRVDAVDALVLTGGEDVEPHRYGRSDAAALCRTNPRRDAIEWDFLERLRRRAVPMLAICRGAQLVNVFLGGTLVPDLGHRNAFHAPDDQDQPRTHTIFVDWGTELGRSARVHQGEVNSSHHQAVEHLPPGFRVSARSGDGVIEAFERQRPGRAFFMAVQWHPESMPEGCPLADRVLDALLLAETFPEKH
jgi:putative glutamine amidotransferase